MNASPLTLYLHNIFLVKELNWSTPKMWGHRSEAATGVVLWKKMFLKIFQISQGNIYITKILKLGRDPGLFFRVHPAGRKKHFFIILRWKKALILIYNKLVTKKIFFRNEHQSNFLSCTFLVELHVFRSGHGKPKYF